jgi:hypothetical protein
MNVSSLDWEDIGQMAPQAQGRAARARMLAAAPQVEA